MNQFLRLFLIVLVISLAAFKSNEVFSENAGSSGNSGAVPTMTEHVVPLYIGSKTAASGNNARTPFAVCLQIQGLAPNTTYDVQIGIGLTTDAATVYGAGNVWNRNRNAFTGQRDTAAFTTDANGDSGPFWSFLQPTGNGTRFNAGQVHNLRVGYTLSGGSFSGDPAFVGTKSFTAVDIAVTERTPAVTDDGAFIRGTGFTGYGSKYILYYDNVLGTGNPLSCYQVRNSTATNPSQSELPAEINDIYMQSGSSAAGDFAGVIPIGANNPQGLRRIEIRNQDNSIAGVITDNDGAWQNGTNTTALVRREVGVIDFSSVFSMNLNVFLEGLYNSTSNTTVADLLTVQLRSSAFPYQLIDEAQSDMNAGGSSLLKFSNAVNATPYYVVIHHRNSIETWSSAPQSFTAGSLSYDFTASAGAAFGNNMALIDNSPVRYGLYSGDVNQDGTVDASDLGTIDNDAFNFISGYVPSDLNGDGFTDASDYSIGDNNAFNFVGIITP